MAEIDGLVQSKLDNMKVQDLGIWQDHAPAMGAGPDAHAGAHLIQQLDLESVQKAFEADVLKLARDMSSWSEWQNVAQTSERKAAISRVLRLKGENKRGAQLVVGHMDRSCRFKLNHYSEEHFCITEARTCHL